MAANTYPVCSCGETVKLGHAAVAFLPVKAGRQTLAAGRPFAVYTGIDGQGYLHPNGHGEIHLLSGRVASKQRSNAARFNPALAKRVLWALRLRLALQTGERIAELELGRFQAARRDRQRWAPFPSGDVDSLARRYGVLPAYFPLAEQAYRQGCAELGLRVEV